MVIRLKKQIYSFLLNEKGSIAKNNIFKFGVLGVMLSLAQAERVNAITPTGINVTAYSASRGTSTGEVSISVKTCLTGFQSDLNNGFKWINPDSDKCRTLTFADHTSAGGGCGCPDNHFSATATPKLSIYEGLHKNSLDLSTVGSAIVASHSHDAKRFDINTDLTCANHVSNGGHGSAESCHASWDGCPSDHLDCIFQNA